MPWLRESPPISKRAERARQINRERDPSPRSVSGRERGRESREGRMRSGEQPREAGEFFRVKRFSSGRSFGELAIASNLS